MLDFDWEASFRRIHVLKFNQFFGHRSKVICFCTYLFFSSFSSSKRAIIQQLALASETFQQHRQLQVGMFQLNASDRFFSIA